MKQRGENVKKKTPGGKRGTDDIEPPRRVTRRQAKLLASAARESSATSATNNSELALEELSAVREPSATGTSNHSEDSSLEILGSRPPSAKGFTCMGTTSPRPEQPELSIVDDDVESEYSNASTSSQLRALLDNLYESGFVHEALFPFPSSSPNIAHGPVSLDPSSRQASRDEQVRDRTVSSINNVSLVCGISTGKSSLTPTAHEPPKLAAQGPPNPDASSSIPIKEKIMAKTNETTEISDIDAVRTKTSLCRTAVNVSCRPQTAIDGYFSESATEQPITNPTHCMTAIHGFCPTCAAEKAEPSSDLIGDWPETCSGHPDRHEIPGRSSSMGLTEIVNMWDAQDPCEDEVESPALVPVGRYKVKQASKPILDLIFHKRGDIAANFVMLTPESRSSVLDEVCEIIQKFQEKKFSELFPCELQRVVGRIHDLERAGLEVGWLLERLEDVLEALLMLKQSSALKEERDVNSEAVKKRKMELQDLEQKVLLSKQRTRGCRSRVPNDRRKNFKNKEESSITCPISTFGQAPLNLSGSFSMLFMTVDRSLNAI